MTVLFAVTDCTTLLVSRVLAEGRGCGLDFFREVGVSIVEFFAPDLTRPYPSLCIVTKLMELVIISTSEEGSRLRDYFETPTLTVVVRNIVEFVVLTCDIKCADPSIIMSYKNLVIHVVNG